MRSTLDPRVKVTGTGSYVPERVIDNDTLATMVTGYDETTSGPFSPWVDQVTHIHERRFCEPGDRTSDLALVAARQALDAAGIEPSDLDLVVYASFTLSQILPGDHCVLTERLGAHGTPTFNLLAACAGSVYGMAMAYATIAAGVYDHVLVVGAETITRVMNYTDPITAILFGDGAGAVVLSRNEGQDGAGMLQPDMRMEFNEHTIRQGNSNVPVDVVSFPDRQLRPGVPTVEQSMLELASGPSVLRRAVVHMAATAVRCLGYDPRDLKRGNGDLRRTLDEAWIVPHQANGRIIDGLTDKLRVPPGRVIRTIYEYGNVSAASNLIALDYGIRRGNMARRLDDDGHVVEILKEQPPRIQKGDLVLLPSIGGGYLAGCIGFVL